MNPSCWNGPLTDVTSGVYMVELVEKYTRRSMLLFLHPIIPLRNLGHVATKGSKLGKSSSELVMALAGSKGEHPESGEEKPRAWKKKKNLYRF